MVKVFIDPGHGGTDPGAVGNGLQEKNLTLQISTRIRDMLVNEYNDVSVLMSRTGDQSLTLTQRTNAANSWGADFLLSVHINAGGGTGYEDFIYPGVGAPTTTYQNLIHEEIMKLVNFRDRGKKSANFHMLRESRMPALLTENGFIDNAEDAAKLKSPSFIENIARGHVNGIVRCFGLTRKTSGIYHTVVAGDTVYGLSQRYGSTIQQIRSWNNLDANYTIVVGQVLLVAGGPSSSTSSSNVGKPAPKGDIKTTSIVDYLNSIKQDSSYANRARLAKQHGINNYSGTSAQNTQLLNKLRK
ncbi:N-acetylmuramoyl-L-alanine amidase family protein [Sutcliffiella horikoshii]|uniref:N-acetylmuramoyl-L-alanine amidase family protein n=1 Tax=Sutcliffiella horikoshii TaxID=79883 RepID=UPI0009EE65CC|nr:N-acetylmuramoyl-L-alanine amidase [Sutcliffiella horikoshii]